jgi:hypothetical protein
MIESYGVEATSEYGENRNAYGVGLNNEESRYQWGKESRENRKLVSRVAGMAPLVGIASLGFVCRRTGASSL